MYSGFLMPKSGPISKTKVHVLQLKHRTRYTFRSEMNNEVVIGSAASRHDCRIYQDCVSPGDTFRDGIGTVFGANLRHCRAERLSLRREYSSSVPSTALASTFQSVASTREDSAETFSG